MKSTMLLTVLVGTLAGSLCLADDEAKPDYAAESQAALKQAVKWMEEGDVDAFLDNFAPYDEVMGMRLGGYYDDAVRVLSVKPLPKNFAPLVALMKKMESVTPTIDEKRMVATFIWSPPKKPSEGGDEEEVVEYDAPSYDGDLDAVLKSAIADLEGEKAGAALERLYPVSMLTALSRMHGDGFMDEQVATINAKSRSRFGNGDVSTIREAMVADLKKVSEMEAELSEDGSMATFKIERAPIAQRFGEPKKVAPRLIKFQKTDKGWRFADSAAKVAEELSRISKLPPASVTEKLTLIRIGSQWRLFEEQR